MKPTDKPHVIVGALSHPGEQRDHNEDRYSITAYQVEPSGEPSLLAVVADGIGGHQAGEIASELTVETVVNRIGSSSGRDPLPTLRAAVSDAAHAVIEASKTDDARQGMGSTLALVWLLGDRTYLTYIGDSPIYLLREGDIQQLSNDHTWVQEALDHEIISPDEAEDHPHAHVLRRHIGGTQPPEPDLRVRFADDPDPAGSASHQGFRLQPNDQLLLCSDGLTDLVNPDEIAKELLADEPGPAAEALVGLARARGGHDNITVVILRVPKDGVAPTPKKRGGWRLFGPLLFALIGAAAAITLAYLFGLWPFALVALPAIAIPGFKSQPS